MQIRLGKEKDLTVETDLNEIFEEKNLNDIFSPIFVKIIKLFMEEWQIYLIKIDDNLRYCFDEQFAKMKIYYIDNRVRIFDDISFSPYSGKDVFLECVRVITYAAYNFCRHK